MTSCQKGCLACYVLDNKGWSGQKPLKPWHRRHASTGFVIASSISALLLPTGLEKKRMTVCFIHGYLVQILAAHQ